MPPVTKAGGEQFRKDVEFVAKDDDEQVAAGIVMVPDKADLQNDFVREDTLRSFADQFETFVEAGEAGGGIMHAVFPDGWMDLERNEVLDESEEIGGQTVDAGAWVQEWSINNGDLWTLIDEGILAGYSIGARDVQWDGPYEQDADAVDDVDVSEAPDDELVWELVDGIIREVSSVDIPAVPDAEILEAKADADKRLGDYLGDPGGFIEEALERGHSEEEAQQLWDVLTTARDVEGADQPGEKSRLHEAAKAFLSVLSGGGSASSEDVKTESTPDPDDGASPSDPIDDGQEKTETETDVEEPEATDKDAPGGDTPDDTTDMSDDTPDEDPEKSLAEQNAEQINELTQAVENLTESLTGPEAKTAEIEIDGETYEVREDAAKAALGVDEGEDVADAIERLNEKASRVDEVEERLDTISQQSGVSTQLERSGEGEESDESGLESLGKALS